MAVRADLVVFAAGAVLFGAGLAGILTLPEGEGGPLQTFTVTWREQSKDLTFDPVSIADNAQETADVNVSDGNLTRLVFVFACTDRHPLPTAQTAASLDILLTPPRGGKTVEASGVCAGEIEVPYEVQPAPTVQSATGTSEANAREGLLAARVNLTTIGEWGIDLSLSRPTGLIGGQVGGADVAILARAVRHEPTVTALPR